MRWTVERVEMLKRLCADGLSASQIAAELGNISRNAVIGKVSRLGLSGQAKAPSSRNNRVKSRPNMLFVPKTNARAVAQMAQLEEEERDLAEEIIPEGQRVTLLELTDEHCHWPVGDPLTPGFFYCGGKPLPRKQHPYCSYHLRLSYEPPRAQRSYNRTPGQPPKQPAIEYA